MRSKNDHLGNNIINKCKEVISLQVGGGEGTELGTGHVERLPVTGRLPVAGRFPVLYFVIT